MGDLGAADQLTSAREENKILKAKVEEFKEKIKDLTITNAQLLAEVEIYRKESPIPSSSFSNIALGQTPNNNPSSSTAQDRDSHFVSSGNGKFPTSPEVSLLHLHSFSNPLCCALDPSDTILATGGADSSVSIVPWGSALAPGEESSRQTVDKAARVVCSAPVICVRFSGNNIVAAGCMDGSVHLIGYRLELGRVRAWSLNIANQTQIKHTKYVKSMDWAPGVDAGGASILASASADGTVQICKIAVELEDVDVDMDDDGSDMNIHANANNATARVDLIKSLHMTGAVEAVCFVNDGDKLCIYERGTSHLAYFDLNDDFKMSTFSLNGSVTGGFDSHVSFTIMHLSLSPNGKYLCAATDTSRNIILEVGTDNIIRDLYGHKNDGFSQPRIAWSSNGQYIYGNTQEDSSICVWDIASAKMVKMLKGHSGQLRDITSSRGSDTVVTCSYDKTVKIWLNEM